VGTQAVELARRLADACEAADLPYAIGGAIALGYWAAPRATNDVDIDLFVDEPGLERAFDAMLQMGLTLDRDEARRQVAQRGDFRAWSGEMRVDVFVAFDPIHEDVRARCRRMPLAGRPASILAAEDLCVFKMLFDRPKDWVDLELIVASQGARLDAGTVRSVFSYWIGESDARLARFDALLVRYDVTRGG
jgi:hypothetical protein